MHEMGATYAIDCEHSFNLFLRLIGFELKRQRREEDEGEEKTRRRRRKKHEGEDEEALE